MVAVSDLAGALGPGVVRVLVAVPGAQVTDVDIAEPNPPGGDHSEIRGHLILGPGVVDAAGAIAMIRDISGRGASGAVLRRAPARARGVRAEARRQGVALLELDDAASLAHVVGLVRDVLDRSITPGAEAAEAGPGPDLMALADAAARVVDAPVTIEDAQSRVLAYSARHDVLDPARVSTIVGRRVPTEIVSALRSRGVFRRMLRSDEPFLVRAGRGLERPRFVVPVRAGGEWLGSIWVVTDQVPPRQVVAELRRTAGVVALHLLRARAASELARTLAVERVRAVLSGEPVDLPGGWLPSGPWRAILLAGGQTDTWSSRLRTSGWRQPFVADLSGRVFAVVADPDPPRQGPGTWAWLVALAPNEVSAGLRVDDVERLPASAAMAGEVAALGVGGPHTPEEAWAQLTVARAAASAAGLPEGPVAALAASDERRHTAYLESLAAWLDHPGEPRAAARSLGIHVNTLRHRMVRMGAVAELDLDDPVARLALRLRLAARGV